MSVGFRKSHLFALGFLTLFLELALIRYLAGNIWNLGYFPNFVLLAVFIGMGAGFVVHPVLDERRSQLAFAGAGVALLTLVLFVWRLHPAIPGFGAWSGIVAGELYFSAAPQQASTAILSFAAWFLLLITLFAAISQRTAKVFRAFPPLEAYTADIAGALSGIVAFSLCSLASAPAAAWFVVAGVVAVFGVAASNTVARVVVAATCVSCALVAWTQDRTLTAKPDYAGPVVVEWSPYQKLEYTPTASPPAVFANGLVHQVPLDQARLEKQFYDVPYRYRRDVGGPPIQNVMIIGAGTGNDLAAALLHGAAHVDAVEIDPEIAALGKAHHPMKPYDDPRVTLHVGDGRAVMNHAEQNHYDLVVFALTDSVVKVSAVAQLRLENYLFTVESIRRATSLLRENGSLVLYNYYRSPWLVEKLLQMLREGSGTEPEVLSKNDDFVVFHVGKNGPAPSAATAIDVPTDDWPFLYLEHRGMPAFYGAVLAFVLALIVVLLAALTRLASKRDPEAAAMPLALKIAFLGMGAAFLLLETKSVVQFSLLFGVTWYNAAFVFVGVLSLVLVANRTVPLLEGKNVLWPVYGALVGSCLLTFVVPLSSLLDVESTALRLVGAILLTFLPLYFANVLFGLTFAKQKAAEHLFGWNLAGSTLGGALEYTCMATGYQMLAVLVALIYSIVFALLLRHTTKSAP